MPIHEITSQEMLEEVIKEHPAVVVDYYSDRCPPCAFIAPRIEKHSDEDRFSDVYFVRANVRVHKDVRDKASLSCIPTLAVYKQGAEVEKVNGEGLIGVSDTGLVHKPNALVDLFEKAL